MNRWQDIFTAVTSEGGGGITDTAESAYVVGTDGTCDLSQCWIAVSVSG